MTEAARRLPQRRRAGQSTISRPALFTLRAVAAINQDECLVGHPGRSSLTNPDVWKRYWAPRRNRVSTLTPIDDAHAKLLRNDQLQFDFSPPRPPPEPPPEWLSWFSPHAVTIVWVLVTLAALLVVGLTLELPAQTATQRIGWPAGPAPA